MKNILIPTDFSDVSGSALEYGLQLARHFGAKVILLHAYHIPMPVTEAPVVLISDEDLRRENLSTLNKFRDKLLLQGIGQGLEIECIVESGFAVDEIPAVAAKSHADLIVMGVSGTGMVDEYLVGSSTSGVIRNTKIPVLVVPRGCSYRKLEHIGLAYDYKGVVDRSRLETLKELCRSFHAHLYVFCMEKEGEKISVDKAVSGLRLENILQDVQHSLHFPKQDDFVEGINQFAADHALEMVSMLPHKHGILERLLNRSITRKMVFHAQVPLLVVPN
ncbi:MAG: hypothetical protein RLZZ46_1050 [Bacteroidota bacterium]|jgi:nucleotide-binding universal stress UspA family protein